MEQEIKDLQKTIDELNAEIVDLKDENKNLKSIIEEVNYLTR